MKDYAVVIVENRKDIQTRDILRHHKRFLPVEWEMRWYSIPSIVDAESYNAFMTSVSFWNDLLKYDRVLICQHDSGLLRKGVEEFLEWSYVGAPWKDDAPWNPGQGGNGGLSLRDPKASLETIAKIPYHPKYGNEDAFYSKYMKNVAPKEVCEKFSVETQFKLGSMGYHAIDKYLSDLECSLIMNQYK